MTIAFFLPMGVFLASEDLAIRLLFFIFSLDTYADFYEEHFRTLSVLLWEYL